jgi:hypothetical protein
MTARQHDSVLYFAVRQIDHSTEEEGSTRSPRESRADQFGSIR